MSDLLRVLALLALVAGNAFFVIGEYAVVTARRGAISDRGGTGARAALRLMSDPVRVISTVQVGITAIGILTGAVGEPLVRDLLGDGIPQWLGFLIAFATITYLSVVFGELVPKALTLDRAERLVVLIAPPIEMLSRVLGPVVWVLERSAEVVLRLFGVREVVAGSMTIDDFNEAVGTSLPQDDARTLAGLVFNGLGRRPEPGDVATADDVTLTVEEVDANRIARLRVRAPARASNRAS